jgi:hypothetical protein
MLKEDEFCSTDCCRTHFGVERKTDGPYSKQAA